MIFKNLHVRKLKKYIVEGRCHLLIGGTGFYMNAVLNNYEFTDLEEKTYDIDVDMAREYLKRELSRYI